MNTGDLTRPVLEGGESWADSGWKVLGVSAHPVAPLPDEAWLRSHSLGELLDFINEREQVIHAMQADPFRHGYEQPSWAILDALMGFPWADPDEAEVRSELDPRKREKLEGKRAWCLQVRRALLKQDEPLRVLLLNGGNRAAKSEWAASRTMRLLMGREGRRAWAFHQDEAMSVEYQQPLLWKYLPAELRTEKGIRRNPTYIAYKQQTGFSEGRFVLPNRSDCSFRNYMQGEEKIQGGELDVIWCDELVPAAWVKELKARVATRSGWLLITFTPVRGYTPTVKMFLDVAEVTREAVAWVLPADGQAARPDLALRGDDARVWHIPGMSGQPAVPEGRSFERVPRAARIPGDKRSGVFWLHCWDNPFGNPAELYAMHQGDTAEYRKMKFYGVATKAHRGQFPGFDRAVHVVPGSAVPAKGTRYMVCDPCSGRNWAMVWALVDRAPVGKRVWIYREWPSPGKYVPGVGDMGEWAVPGEKVDGERGPAQAPLGWGHVRYRQEVFRLEGRREWEQAGEAVSEDDFVFDDRDRPAPVRRRPRRRPSHEGGEEIYERLMDSRAGAAPTQTREGQTTLLEECAKLDFQPDFMPASGRDIEEGTYLINDLLTYDRDQPITSLNGPRLLVSEECVNMIFALQNWTGVDGQKGACKDFIDLLRYLLLHEPEDYDAR